MEAQVILRYQLYPGVNMISLPVGAKVLSVTFGEANLLLWAQSPVAEGRRKERLFEVVYTGLSFDPEGRTYLGTTQAHEKGVPNVHVHVFEVTPKDDDEHEELELLPSGRGFDRSDFVDRYDQECSLQKSSLADEDAIWLGAKGSQMLLTQAMVARLLPALHRFVQTGELRSSMGEEE